MNGDTTSIKYVKQYYSATLSKSNSDLKIKITTSQQKYNSGNRDGNRIINLVLLSLHIIEITTLLYALSFGTGEAQ